MHKKIYRKEPFFFIVYLLLALILTYPLILRLNSSVFSDPEWMFDTKGTLYRIWWLKYSFQNNLGPAASLIGIPFQSQTEFYIPKQIGLEWPLFIMALWGNPFISYNIFMLMSYLLSAIFMYLLVFYLTKNRVAGFISGLIYAFYPNHTLQAFAHLGQTAVQWMVLYVLFLIRWENTKKKYDFIGLIISFIITLLTFYQYGYFLMILTLGYLFFRILYFRDVLSYFRKYKFTIIFAFLLAIPFLAGYFYLLNREGIRREYHDLFNYCARLIDYIMPSEYHPIFGNFTRNRISRHWSEKTLYLGVLPLLLGLYGFLKGFKGKDRYIVLQAGFGFLFSIFVSLAPVMKIFSVKLPTPSFFLYHIFPMFRTYCRYGFIAQIFLCILAGYGIRELNAKFRRMSFLTNISIIGIILFEFTVIPPFRNADFKNIPPAYRWLEKEPDVKLIVEYPFESLEGDTNFYKFYQMWHLKPQMNGVRTGTFGEDVRRETAYINNPESAEILKYFGVDLILVHKDKYDSNTQEAINKNPMLILVKDYGDVIVYKLSNQIPGIIKVYKNFGMWEKWDNNEYWRWMGKEAGIWLSNTTGRDLEVSVSFNAVSFNKERRLTISLNGKSIKDILIYPDTKKKGYIMLENIKLPPGESEIGFNSLDGSAVIDSVLHNGDKRDVSFAISRFEIKLNRNKI